MNKRIITKEFKVNSLEGRKKKVRVFLPKDYDNSEKRYPVLYMHDGQNLVDKSLFSNYAWDVMKTMDLLSDTAGDMIIVGMDSDAKYRITEYSAFMNPVIEDLMEERLGLKKDEIKAEADEYGTFILTQVIPYINQEFRTLKGRENTYIAGSSAGGNVSVYLGLKYQDTFSVIGAFSSAYWIFKEQLFTYIKNLDIRRDLWIYHDTGGKESGLEPQDYLKDLEEFQELMLTKLPENHLLKVIDLKATHSEKYWALRFPLFYQFCLKKE